MSNEPLTWALRDAPDVPAHALAVLIGLANHAGPEGTHAFPSNPRLARYARKTIRQVRSDLRALEKLGLIRPGDQRFVQHKEADRRPFVWDLAVERVRGKDDGWPADRKPASGRGGKPASPKPSVQPSDKSLSLGDVLADKLPAVAADEREKLANWIIAKHNPHNPRAYLRKFPEADLQAELAEMQSGAPARLPRRQVTCDKHLTTHPEGAECRSCAADRKAGGS